MESYMETPQKTKTWTTIWPSISTPGEKQKHEFEKMAIEKNELLSLEATWMDLGNIILSEMSGKNRQILYDITCIWSLKK